MPRAPAATGRTLLAFCLLGSLLVNWAEAGWCDHPVWRDPAMPVIRRLPVPAPAGRSISREASAISLWIEQRRAEYAATRDPRLAYELAELLVARAVAADRAGHPSAVDLYFQAAGFAWLVLSTHPPGDPWNRGWHIYHTGVARLLLLAQRQGRILPGQGLIVHTASGPALIPLVLQGFAWRAEDFQELHPVADYRSQVIERVHRRPGWGVPLVVRRTRRTFLSHEEPFLADETSFVATALLRPEADLLLAGSGPGRPAATLELYNPLAVAGLDSPLGPLPLGADLSALFTFREVNQPPSLGALDLFLRPDTTGGPQGLYFLEPYQPGKIPVVLIHGLLSSPWTWAGLANDLRAQPGFTDHFQLWLFRYATGAPFLESAARLRTSAGQALATVDPGGSDPALRQMVLVGHSMGGLVAKLQVVSGGDPLWSAIANRPPEQIAADPVTRARLVTTFYFPPQPFVRRVVFIATPHGGSSWAQSCLGRIGADLVRREETDKQAHAVLIAANPGVFSREFQTRLPTSVDLLETTSPLLQTIRAQPIGPGVRCHTIAGTGGLSCGHGPGDGVVSLDSARHPGAASELFVPATHSAVHHRPETAAEVARILREQLAEFQASSARAQAGR